jgi:hypothetical protein
MTDKEKYLEFWGYTLGTPEAEEAWEAKVKMMTAPTRPDYMVMGDQHYDGLRAHDGSDISTRSKHREFKKRTGLVDFDDYKGTFEKAQKERDAYHSGEKGTINRKDIERTIAQMTGQY